MRLRTGQNAAAAVTQLRELVVACEAVINWNGPPERGRDAYLAWTERAETTLRHLFVEPDLADGLQTARYWHIRDVATGPQGPAVRPHPLISAEVAVQAAVLTDAADRLEEFARLRAGLGKILMLDTNSFLHCVLFTQVDWLTEFGATRARLVVPLLVLDELDDKTFSGNNRLAKRADKVLREFDKYIDAIVQDGLATITDNVTMEVLSDEDDHRRRTNHDTELLDRAEFLHQVTEQKVTIVTTDRGMRVRGQARDLIVQQMPGHLRLPLAEDTPTG